MPDDTKTARAFRYALLPTEGQEAAIQRQEAQLRMAWNRMVNWQRCTLRDWHHGRQTALLAEYCSVLSEKNFTGQAAAKANRLAEKEGISAQDALKVNRREAVKRVAKFGKRRLGVVLAQERLMQKAEHFYGGQKCLLYGLIQKFQKSCENWLKLLGTAQAPCYKRDHHDRVALQRQITKSTPVSLGKVSDLSALFGQSGKRTRVVWHRPLPEGAAVKQLAICGRSGRRYLVVFFTCPMTSVLKPFPARGGLVGVDTGYCMALTAMAGHTDEPEHYSPPYSRDEVFLRRNARLQRKWDRQVRANNPECFDAAGRWIKGKRMTVFSKGMLETKNRMQADHERVANARHEFYHLTAHSLLMRYGRVALGNWRPMVDVTANEGKDKTKKRRNHHRKAYDHALSTFTSIVEDKARLSATLREVVHVEEPWTTQTCACCRRLTGPAEITNILEWRCEECGALNHRKANNAINIAVKAA